MKQAAEKLLSLCLGTNLDMLRKELGDSADVSIRQVVLGESAQRAALVRIDGISDEAAAADGILQPLLKAQRRVEGPLAAGLLQEEVLTAGGLKKIGTQEQVLEAILEGDTVLFLDQCDAAIAVHTKGGEQRAVAEPTTQTVIRGPKESFVENIRTNTALVRKRLHSPKLRVEKLLAGSVSRTKVEMMYMEGVADGQTLAKIRERINRAQLDMVLESAYIEKLIEDRSDTLFPTILNTERPDAVAANLAEGRIAVFIDGTPFVLIAPASFFQFFQSPEDFYERKYISWFIRGVRFASFFIALLAPSVYIALITYHQAMLPTRLLISLYAQREGVPFPSIVEAFIMELLFEILREAGVRMPRAVGQAVSIVGALVLGQAAVQAGLVSTAMVIVVSITAISSFTLPVYSLAVPARLLRFTLMFVAYYLGFYGLLLSMLAIVAHICSLRSVGIMYVANWLPSSPGAAPYRGSIARIFNVEEPHRCQKGGQEEP
ncbi:spore germination protein [Ectobacillus ponti]|uniref:Spore germination protein n=1 Tax=Ectobacillus ponti TaxID=2961894 RepID=A0AA41X5U7_9BACI|nr:spore germination protein [Ectobacillus ponti]MCP8969232.1 spore germination protein [Ectobacillus ponti]